MLTGLLLFVIVVLRGFPETAFARWLDRAVMATFGRITRTHLIFLIVMSIVLFAGTELLAMAGPFDIALVVMWDVSAYIDIVLTTAVVAGAARGGAGGRMIVARLIPRSGRRRSARARRQRTMRPRVSPANDDDRPAFGLAA